MSQQNPYEQLGVTENATFEEIQDAKTRLTQEYQNDSKQLESIEAAYDAVIMDRLRMRQEGRIKVPDRIRFPERSVPNNPPSPPVSASSSPAWLTRMLDTPSQGEWLWQSLVFWGLAAITLFTQGQSSSVALWLALGTIAHLYFLTRKENKFGRAFLITLVGLVVGIAIGTLLSQLISPGLMDQTQVACVITLLIFWLSSCFLR